MSSPDEDDFVRMQERWKTSGEKLKETHSAAFLPENTKKNRYYDVIPCDEHRVKLQGDGSDYINASFVVGPTGVKYVSAQAPVAASIVDFWRMIWQENIGVVMMLTKEEERQMRKADAYWPVNPGDSIAYGPIFVTLESLSRDGETIMRRLRIRHAESGEERLVSHVQYIGWPDFGVPQSVDGFLTLLSVADREIEQVKATGPLLVHCSAGIGRSGTFIAAHEAAAQLRQGISPNLLALVDTLRSQRRGMVQTREQYLFLKSAVDELHGEPVQTDE
eukprot:TRINITY_DN12990_c0_g1_i1.p1 TRINITY_DN12990_c0_g1~~TRINITY_DN12990_c0_g1_i1.p1  ORF type:complete len:276 (+),score=33.49 TRINITY_DN12990_c0_g1_i1:40-867(+)